MPSLRLMVVDADDFAAMLTGAALSSLGHRVDKFASADIALEVLREAPGAYDAVFAGSSLDTMTGLQFAREAQRHDGRLRMLGKDEQSGGAPFGKLYVLPKEHLFCNAAAMQSLRHAAENSIQMAA